MRVLNIMTGGLRREGITTTQLDYVRFMDKDIKFDIAAVHNNARDVIEEFETLGCRVPELPDRKKNIIRYMLALYGLMKKEQYDILHVHGSSALMSVELMAGKLAHIKVRIAHSRNTKSDHASIDKILRPLFHSLYSAAFSCGKEAGEWLFGTHPFEIIHNGKDLEKFFYNPKIRDKIRKEYGWQDKVVLGHVGNFNYQKNHVFLIETFRHLVGEEKFQLCLIGDGPEMRDIKNRVKNYGLSDKVLFTGQINNVSEMLQAMDIMLLPSRFEGLPNVVLEWQASALPCIISDQVTRECAVTELTEFLSIDDTEDWVQKVKNCVLPDREKNAEKYRKQLAEAGFDLRENVKELKKIYYALSCND